jgi:hypothetical protein
MGFDWWDSLSLFDIEEDNQWEDYPLNLQYAAAYYPQVGFITSFDPNRKTLIHF